MKSQPAWYSVITRSSDRRSVLFLWGYVPETEITQARKRHGIVYAVLKYLLHTEVHTFAFSVAANAILSFFPFMLLLMTVILRVFHSPAMYRVIVELLRDYLPAGQDFVIRNLGALATARNRVQLFSFV